MRAFVQRAGGTFTIPPGDKVPCDAPPLTPERCEATVKDLDRARAKADDDYDGDARRVVDFVRASGIFETPAHLVSALAQLDETPDLEDHAPRLRVVRAKDKFNHPRDGYRDLLLNVALVEDGDEAHVGELQMHIAAIIEKKEAAHVSYGITRGLDLDAGGV